MILGCGQGLCLLTVTFPFAPPGIALYPGQAQLLSCKHHYEVIPPLRSPGRPGDVNCTTQRINYTDPFSNQTLVRLRAGQRALSAPHPRPRLLSPVNTGTSGPWPWLAHLPSVRVTLRDSVLQEGPVCRGGVGPLPGCSGKLPGCFWKMSIPRFQARPTGSFRARGLGIRILK